jgi:hypothetical protein
MFLRKIVLTRFRSLDSLTLDFAEGGAATRRWTLLVGENGSGKSSVLRAVGLLLAGSEALPGLVGDPDAWIGNGADECSLAASLVTAKGELREVALVMRRGDGIQKLFERNRVALAQLDAAIAHSDRAWFTLGYGAGRRLPGAGAGVLSDADRHRSARARCMATLFSADAPLVSLEQWAMDLDYRRGEAGLASVRQALDGLLPGMVFKRIDRERRQMIFATSDGEVPLSQLSDGYQGMAAWCGDLLYRITEAFPDRADPLATHGVLLIDELDLHLHPVWRRRLVDFLSSTLPNFQFIATTHSALTAQQSGEGELFAIRREGETALPALVPFVGEPRRLLLHQLLMSPMFGLDSMDSLAVERARDAVRGLLDRKAGLTAAEVGELAAQQRILFGAPRWDAIPHYAREQMELLENIKSAMGEEVRRAVVSGRRLKAVAKRLDAKE